MAQVIDSILATLEYLELVVEPLDKATTLVMSEGVGDAIKPGVQQFQEGGKAGLSTGFDLSPPRGHASHACRF